MADSTKKKGSLKPSPRHMAMLVRKQVEEMEATGTKPTLTELVERSIDEFTRANPVEQLKSGDREKAIDALEFPVEYSQLKAILQSGDDYLKRVLRSALQQSQGLSGKTDINRPRRRKLGS